MRASHMQWVLDMSIRDQMVKETVKALKPHLNEFDCIAFSGMSGALIAPLISKALKKPLVLVRKQGDSSHSAHMGVEGQDHGRYIILDDFMASGDTVKYIINTIKATVGNDMTLVGFYMYRGWGWWNKDSIEKEFGVKFYGANKA